MKDNHEEFMLFYEMNKDKFPGAFREMLDRVAEISEFQFGTCIKCSKRMVPQLRKLMMKQYPIFKEAKHPLLTEFMEMVNDNEPYVLLTLMRNVLRQQDDEIDLDEQYPDL